MELWRTWGTYTTLALLNTQIVSIGILCLIAALVKVMVIESHSKKLQPMFYTALGIHVAIKMVPKPLTGNAIDKLTLCQTWRSKGVCMCLHVCMRGWVCVCIWVCMCVCVCLVFVPAFICVCAYASVSVFV